jgi:hypothetical protein
MAGPGRTFIRESFAPDLDIIFRRNVARHWHPESTQVLAEVQQGQGESDSLILPGMDEIRRRHRVAITIP